MALEKRGSGLYYYPAQRVGRRVVKRYVGTGLVSELVAHLETAARLEKTKAAERKRKELAELAALEEALAPLNELADAMTAAALVAAGYHRHHRGPWRKRRA